MAKTLKREFGDWGEEQACQFLLRQNYQIIERNFLSKHGELDIIAWKSDVKMEQILCFVEVKTRSSFFGSAEKATDWEKIRKMKLAAKYFCYIKKIDIDHTFINFEHISVYVERSSNKVLLKKYTLPAY